MGPTVKVRQAVLGLLGFAVLLGLSAGAAWLSVVLDPRVALAAFGLLAAASAMPHFIGKAEGPWVQRLMLGTLRATLFGLAIVAILVSIAMIQGVLGYGEGWGRFDLP